MGYLINKMSCWIRSIKKYISIKDANEKIFPRVIHDAPPTCEKKTALYMQFYYFYTWQAMVIRPCRR